LRTVPLTSPEAWGAARLAAVRAGDGRATTDLVCALLPRVRNLVRYLLAGDRDVDDVAQEALISVLSGLSGFRGDGSFESWSDRVVARTTFQWLRRRRSQRLLVSDEALARLVAEPETGPDEYLHRRRLVARLDELPEEQRFALVMHHVLGMSVTEMSRELQTPAETLRSRIRLARQRLRGDASSEKQREVG
jgi:RNA polymerase sigma-70 factor, ECF subfamily